jgi:hypothetical protein
MKSCDGKSTVAEILTKVEFNLDGVRHLWKQHLILLTPG